MIVQVNGEAMQLRDGMTVADLLRQLERNPKLVAVERNRELVPRREHEECHLSEGDELEIVTLVGGG